MKPDVTTSSGALPTVSVLMPVRNEERFIAQSLRAVLAQDYPTDRIQIIVIDGVSSDSTGKIVADIAQESPIPVTILENPGQIVSTALNIGLAKADGDVIVRVDGHCELEADYISRCVDYLMQWDVDAVGGPIHTVADAHTGKTIAVALSSLFGVGDSAFRTLKHTTRLVDTVAFPAYRREAIERAGPFDEELIRNQDDEYNYRLRKLGGKLLLAEDVRATYHSRSSLHSLSRQYYQYGFYKVRVMQKHPRQMRGRQFVPPLFVASLIGGALLALFSYPLRMIWVAGIGLYLLVNIIASILTARQSGWDHLLLLPIVFATLHISYGLGFLVGLVRFAHRWFDKSVVREIVA